MTATTIEPSLFAKLKDVLGHNRVYPETIPLRESMEGELEPDCELPAWSYRLVSGAVRDSIDRGQSGMKTDTFLIEGFDRDRTAIQQIRTTMFSEFRGPPWPAKPGWPKQWCFGGHKIRWAKATDPAVDSEFATTDAHDVLCYVQFLLEIQYHEGTNS